MNRFKNQVILITGSTQGIGFGIALRLGQEGGFIHICSRKEQNVTEAVTSLQRQGITVMGHVCNVAKKSDREAMLKKI